MNATIVTANEGQSLQWQLRFSAPTFGFEFYCFLIPPAGTELTSSDVPDSWLEALFVKPPSSPVPLSRLRFPIRASFSYGARSAILSVPISKDRKAEGEESISCEYYDVQSGSTLTLVGIVPKHS